MEDSLDLINTTDLNIEIENMFMQEDKFLLILSPYLDISDKIIKILAASKAEIMIIYREINKKSKMKKIDEFKKLLPKVKFNAIQNFHAKAYISSGTFIITSLNLYEHSQINNLELGVVFKGNSYNKMIGKLIAELKILFKTNKLDEWKLSKLKVPTVDELFYQILKKCEKNEKDYPDKELLGIFSKQMMEKFEFDKGSCWRYDEKMLQRWAKVSGDMYEWGLENIKL